jgi:glucose/arabinose dehydrogenase
LGRRSLAIALTGLLLTSCAGAAQPTPPALPEPKPTGQATLTGQPTLTAQPTPTSSPQQSLDQGQVAISLEPFVSGLGALTYLTHAGDGTGRLYAVEQAGVIRLIEPDGTVRDDPFLDISELVRAGGERGLLGLAFHPDYAANGRFFVDYTDSPAGDTVVAEYRRASETAADRSSERVLLQIEQPFGNHNGGMLAFGPDGYLYVSSGDGGSAGDPNGNGQDTASLLGKILRIDVDQGDPYAIPPDNPFAGSSDARPEIWAYGLRNPWRLSFDRLTGDLFIGDVGQGSWEEIDAEPAGEGGRNYGWNVMEGPDCYRASTCDQAGLTLPVAVHGTHADGGCAITGGYVYRGEAHPALAGMYLFSDYCAGIVWALDAAAAIDTGQADYAELARSDIIVSSFGEDEAGELYLAGGDGTILRITAPASPP